MQTISPVSSWNPPDAYAELWSAMRDGKRVTITTPDGVTTGRLDNVEHSERRPGHVVASLDCGRGVCAVVVLRPGEPYTVTELD